MAVSSFTSPRAVGHRTPRAAAWRRAKLHAVAWLESRDHRVMRRINRWRPPRWMRLWMIAATRGGDGWLWYAMGLVVALFGGPERFRALAAASTASAVGIVLFLKIKR